MHGMTGPGQSAHAAQALGDTFILQNLQSAVEAQLLGESTQANLGVPMDAGNYTIKALEYFGNALHTVTDRLSPEHRGEQLWRGLSWPNEPHLPSALWHGGREWASGHWTADEAVYEAEVAASQLWLQFQEMLKKERQKAQEEEQKKKQ